jgi:hypothetical protein
VKDRPASLEGVTYGQHVEYPVVVAFLDKDQRYESLATQILRIGIDLPAGDRIRNDCVQVSNSGSVIYITN